MMWQRLQFLLLFALRSSSLLWRLSIAGNPGPPERVGIRPHPYPSTELRLLPVSGDSRCPENRSAPAALGALSPLGTKSPKPCQESHKGQLAPRVGLRLSLLVQL